MAESSVERKCIYVSIMAHNIGSLCQQCNNLHATTYTPDSGPFETKTCQIVVEEHEIGVIKPGTKQKAVLKTVFGYKYIK
jgi:hypothetical protein